MLELVLTNLFIVVFVVAAAFVFNVTIVWIFINKTKRQDRRTIA